MILVRYNHPKSEHLFSLMIDVPNHPSDYLPDEELSPPSPLGHNEMVRYREALKQCEDSAIGIDNPEVLPIRDQGGFWLWDKSVKIEQGHVFPLPDSIEYEIETYFKNDNGDWQKVLNGNYAQTCSIILLILWVIVTLIPQNICLKRIKRILKSRI